MNLDKAPRWFLMIVLGIAGALAFWGVSYAITNERTSIAATTAEVAKLKPIVYSAQNTAEIAQMQSAELRGVIVKMENTQETFRKEYREDQRTLDQKLANLDRLLRRTDHA